MCEAYGIAAIGLPTSALWAQWKNDTILQEVAHLDPDLWIWTGDAVYVGGDGSPHKVRIPRSCQLVWQGPSTAECNTHTLLHSIGGTEISSGVQRHTRMCERCVSVVCTLRWLDQGHAIESLKAAFSATKASEAYSSAEPRNCAPVLRAGAAAVTSLAL